jgi:hypothetical protein
MTRRWLAGLSLLALGMLLLGALSQRMVHPLLARLAARPPATVMPALPRFAVTPPTATVAPSTAVSTATAIRLAVRTALAGRPAEVRLRVAAADAPVRLDPAHTASPTMVDAILGRVNSPLAGQGPFICEQGRRRGIDPLLLVAMAIYFDERVPLSAAAHNPGRIRATGSQPAIDGYRIFPTWRAGVAAWFALIGDLYARRWGLTTLDQMLPVYASGSGRRGVETALNSLRAMIGAWSADT